MGSKRKERVVVIGCGGIGSWLIPALARFMYYDQQSGWELVLVDGDEYTVSNATRQVFSKLGNKAEVTAQDLLVQFPELAISTVTAYVSVMNANVHEDHAHLAIPINEVVREWDWVFVCVDNHATRKLISDYAQTLNNVRVISGGNGYEDGNVQVFIRRKGNDVFPPLTKAHPEIANPAEKAPYEMSCEELAATSSPQLIFTNMMAATIMSATFYAELTRQLKSNEVIFQLEAQIGKATGPAVMPQLFV